MYLTVVLDKSSFHGLSGAELHVFRRHFRETVTPVLVFEVLGDLTSTANRKKTPVATVVELASKLTNGFGTVNEDHRRVCAMNLLGGSFDFYRGALPDNYFIAPSGGMLIDESPLDHALRRWSQGTFDTTEADFSSHWRKTTRGATFSDLARRLEKAYVLVQRPGSSEQIVVEADKLLATASLQAILLEWLTEQLGISPDISTQIGARWRAAGRPFIGTYARYANHCLRVLLCMMIAVRHKFLGWNPTHLIDAQYLFYLPFCRIFVSNDRVHKLLGPQLCDPQQSFVLHDELKAALKAIVAEEATGRAPVALPPLINDLYERHLGWKPSFARGVSADPGSAGLGRR